MSEEKKAWTEIYNAYRNFLLGTAANRVCARCGNVNQLLDPHHPFGRTGSMILVFVFICRTCHAWIHEHTKDAKWEGWLR